MGRRAGFAVLLALCVALLVLPAARPPAFYESFLYLVFHWVALATSWGILSGYSGYFSFGHGAFFGAGMYATATLATAGLPFLSTPLSPDSRPPCSARRWERWSSACGAFAASCSRCSPSP